MASGFRKTTNNADLTYKVRGKYMSWLELSWFSRSFCGTCFLFTGLHTNVQSSDAILLLCKSQKSRIKWSPFFGFENSQDRHQVAYLKKPALQSILFSSVSIHITLFQSIFKLCLFVCRQKVNDFLYGHFRKYKLYEKDSLSTTRLPTQETVEKTSLEKRETFT